MARSMWDTEMGRDAATALMEDAGYFEWSDEDEVPATPGEAVAEWSRNAATLSEAECPCHGSGWMLHDLDVWVSCPMHFDGQTHPEEEMAMVREEQEAHLAREIALMARVESREHLGGFEAFDF